MITTTKKQTYRDYERLPEGAPYQLIDGELIMTPSPLFSHQDLVLKIAVVLKAYVDKKNAGIVIISPMDVYLAETEVYQPDIIFISNDKKEIIKDRVHGVPDLVVEVLSPSNAYFDLVHKKNVYEAAGVKEYWIVDPQEKTIEVYENVEGQFRLHAKTKQTGTIGSKLIDGFTIELKDLF